MQFSTMRFHGLLLSVFLLIITQNSQAGNTHTNVPTDTYSQMRGWFGDIEAPQLNVGTCAPTAPGSGMTLANVACQGYVRATDGSLIYVQQAATTLTLPSGGGAGFFWVAIHKDVSTNVVTPPSTGWTRQIGTHYVFLRTLTEANPCDPPEALCFMEVSSDGTNITGIKYLNVHSTGGGGGNTGSVPCQMISQHATGGTGTQSAPWMGWEDWTNTALQTENTSLCFDAGWFSATKTIVINPASVAPAGNGIRGHASLQGAGPDTTFVVFNPTTSPQVLFQIGAATNTNVIVGVTLKGLTACSSDTSHVKYAIQAFDIRQVIVRDITVSCLAPAYKWTDTTRHSVGFYLVGRDTSDIGWLYLEADAPMILDGSWNEGSHCDGTYTTGLCNIDRMHFHDLVLAVNGIGGSAYGQGGYVSPPSLQPGLTILNRVALGRNEFNGIVCLGGTYCLYQAEDLNRSSVGPNTFKHIYWEQQWPLNPTAGNVASAAYMQNPANWGYTIFMHNKPDTGSTMYNNTYSDIYQIQGNGISLRGGRGVIIENYTMKGAYNSDGTCYAAPNTNYPCSPSLPLTAPIVLDIGGGLSTAPYDGNYPVTCRTCTADSGVVLTPATQLPVVQAVPSDKNIYPLNPFPSASLVIWDFVSSNVVSSGYVPWTPLLQGTAGNPTVSYTVQVGALFVQPAGNKRLITYYATLQIAAISGGAGNAKVLPSPSDPFPVASSAAGAGLHYAGAMGNWVGPTLSGTNTSLQVYVPAGGQEIDFYEAGTGGGAFLPVSAIPAGTILTFSGSYVAD